MMEVTELCQGLRGPTLLLSSLSRDRWQVEELRVRIRELEEKEKKESKKMADEDALRKIKLAEEQIEHLQKKLAATKQVPSPGAASPSHWFMIAENSGWLLDVIPES